MFNDIFLWKQKFQDALLIGQLLNRAVYCIIIPLLSQVGVNELSVNDNFVNWPRKETTPR